MIWVSRKGRKGEESLNMVLNGSCISRSIGGPKERKVSEDVTYVVGQDTQRNIS